MEQTALAGALRLSTARLRRRAGAALPQMESLIPDFASLNPLHEDVNRVAERMQDLE